MTNPIKQLDKMKKLLPAGFEINETHSLKSDSVYATHKYAFTPPLVWRSGKWKSTAIS